MVKKQNECTQFDCDDTFALIVGYTSGGAPYDTTWEQMGVDPELPYEEKIGIHPDMHSVSMNCS